MRYIKSSWLIVMFALVLTISACNLGKEPEPTPDVGAIFTAAAETVQAQFSLDLTQTALAAPTAMLPPPPPTATSIPTFAIGGSPVAPPVTTPLATVGIGTQPTGFLGLATATPLAALATQAEKRCRDSAFVADVTYADGTVVDKNAWLAKVWSVQNTGTCAWDDGFSLEPVTGDASGKWVIDERKEFVDPNEIVEIRIDVKTPSKRGEFGGCWRMMGDDGYYFGTFLCLLVMVD